MTEDRRQHPRVRYALDASWRGASVGARGRLSDLSLGGCFVVSLSAPAVGERTIVTLTYEDQPLELAGITQQVEPGVGFSLEFEPLAPDLARSLAALIDEVRQRSGEAG